MSITKSVKSPTRNNLIESAMTDAVGRNQDLKMFLKLLHNADEFSTIAINGGWGTGKTFFVKQAQLLIDIFDKQAIDERSEQEASTGVSTLQNIFKDSFNENKLLSALYFDAWLYDDVRDPLGAILFYISEKMGKKYGQCAINIKRLFAEILKQISSIVNINFDYEELKNAARKDYLEEIMDFEDIKDQIVSVFQDPMFSDKRLVFFIDELDRCNPIFALKLLEKVKHFFENTNVLFVFSINCQELAATIRAYYGESFNSEQYLSKFFDLIIDLPPVDSFEIISGDECWEDAGILSLYFQHITNEMHLSIRECERFLDCYKIIEGSLKQILHPGIWGQDAVTQVSYILFPILLLALKIKAPGQYKSFVDGDGLNILKQYVSTCKDIQSTIQYIYGENNGYQGTFEERLEDAYKKVFKANGAGAQYWRLRMEILKLCSFVGARCVYG